MEYNHFSRSIRGSGSDLYLHHRADCVLLADLVRHAAPVRVPASVLAGSQDPLAPATGMERWKDLLAAGFSLDVFEGGHFFPRAHRDEVAGLVSDTLLLYLFQG